MPGALQGQCHHALVLRAGAGLGVRQNLGVGRHEPAQGLRVLVVNRGYLVGTKIADFLNRRLVVLGFLLVSHK